MQMKVQKWGNGVAVRIPEAFVRELGLRAGSPVNVTVSDGGIAIGPVVAAYTLEELLAGITPENLHGETDWGPPVGRESW